MPYLSTIFSVLSVIASLLFIVIIAVQTSKNEGLTGSIGAPVAATFKGKPGREEILQKYTRNLAIIWIVVTLIAAAFASRMGALH